MQIENFNSPHFMLLNIGNKHCIMMFFLTLVIATVIAENMHFGEIDYMTAVESLDPEVNLVSVYKKLSVAHLYCGFHWRI